MDTTVHPITLKIYNIDAQKRQDLFPLKDFCTSFDLYTVCSRRKANFTVGQNIYCNKFGLIFVYYKKIKDDI